MPEGCSCRIESAQDRVCLVLAGELDLSALPKLEAALRETCAHEAGDLTLDLRALTFMDCSGLRFVLLANDVCEATGRRLEIVRGRRNVQRLFDIAGLDGRVRFRESAEGTPCAA